MRIIWDNRQTQRPTQGVRQRLRDLLKDRGVQEAFRIDRCLGNKRKTLVVRSAIRLFEMPHTFEEYRVVWKHCEQFELNYEERLRAQRKAEVEGITVSTDLIFKEFQTFAPVFDDSYRDRFFHCLVFGKQSHRQEGFIVSTVDEAMAIICKRMPLKVICGNSEVLQALAGKQLPVVGNQWYEDNIFLVMRRQTTEELRPTVVNN